MLAMLCKKRNQNMQWNGRCRNGARKAMTSRQPPRPGVESSSGGGLASSSQQPGRAENASTPSQSPRMFSAESST